MPNQTDIRERIEAVRLRAERAGHIDEWLFIALCDALLAWEQLPSTTFAAAGATVPPTPARVERFIVQDRHGKVLWNQRRPPRCFEEWDTDNPDDAPFALIRLVELRAGEVVRGSDDAASAYIESLENRCRELCSERDAARDNAAEWELEAVEHQANAERLGALADSQRWVEGSKGRLSDDDRRVISDFFSYGMTRGNHDGDGPGPLSDVIQSGAAQKAWDKVRSAVSDSQGWVEGVVQEDQEDRHNLGAPATFVMLPANWQPGTRVLVRKADDA